MATPMLAKTLRNIKKREKLIITPLIEDWLLKNDSTAVVTPEDQKLALELLTQQTNTRRDGRFGASARGTCERKQVFQFLGMPVSVMIGSELQNIFNDGKFRHIRWQLMGMKAGAFTHVEVSVKVPEWRLAVSMDAIDDTHPFVFELKGTSQYVSTMTEIPEAHNLQLHTYLFATGWDIAIYVAEDKRTQGFREIIVRRDEKIIRKVKKELNALNDAIEDRTLPAVLPECWQKDGPYKTCPFARRCLAQAAEGDPWPDTGQWASD